MSSPAPMLATPIDLSHVGPYVVNDDWVMEQKLDGHRVMLAGPGTAEMRAIGRNGRYTYRLPTRVRNWREPLDAGATFLDGLVLDGELVGDRYWAFDLLLADGRGWNEAPIEGRRLMLERLKQAMPNAPFEVVPQARTANEKEGLLLRAAQEGLEGVVFKHRSSRYRFGLRSPEWLKAKFVATADLVVVGVRDDGKESVAVGITTDGGATFTAIGRCSLLGKPPVKVGDVVEVRYLYVPDRNNPRLVQPMLVRVRDDKAVAECDGADLRYANRSVLTSL